MIIGEYTCSVEKLLPHPMHKEIYDSKAEPALVESIRANGIREPLVVYGFHVIAGGRRLDAAQQLRLREVPVRCMERGAWCCLPARALHVSPWPRPAWVHDIDLIRAMLDSNINRQKTSRERSNENTLRFMLDYYCGRGNLSKDDVRLRVMDGKGNVLLNVGESALGRQEKALCRGVFNFATKKIGAINGRRN